MITYILEYDIAREVEVSFTNSQFKQKREFVGEHELKEAIGNLVDGIKGRYDDGMRWNYFTVGQASEVVTSRWLPASPIKIAMNAK